MVCPLCGSRKARRTCPALNRQICSVCCGTKRLVEIACPDDCAYLRTAHQHPPAAVQRSQERDLRFLAPIADGLSELQLNVFWMLQSIVGGHQVEGLQRLTDVADAAAALAATLETAERGIIYDHRPGSLVAERLGLALKRALDDLEKQVRRPVGRHAALVLRRIERAARDAGQTLPGGDQAYLDLLRRLPLEFRAADRPAPPESPRIHLS